MARTSAKAKKTKQEVDKSKSENLGKKINDSKPVSENETTNDSTDKENDGIVSYEVEKILHTRVYHGKRQYLVKWKDYDDDDDTWENESILKNCKEVLDTFKKENPSLFNKTKDNSDNDAGDEQTQESDEEIKEKKQPKKVATKKMGRSKSKPDKQEAIKNKDTQEAQASTEDEAEKNDSEDQKGKKRTKKPSNTPSKKSKENTTNSKKKISEDSDDDSVTDGKDYEVEKILEVHWRRDGSREFLIRWKGYKPSDDTWEPEAHLNCHDLISKFMEKVDKAKSIPARELRESRTQTNKFIITNQHRSNLRNPGFRPSYAE